MILFFVVAINVKPSFAEDTAYMPFESLPNPKYADEFLGLYKDTQFRVNFILPSELPQVPAELMVYQRAPQEELTYEKMKEVGDLFEMGEGCTVYPSSTGGFGYVNRGVKSIHFNGSLKNFEFYDIAVEPVEGASLPDETTGKSIVEAYLRSKGLWLEGLEFETIGYATEYNYDTKVKKNVEMTIDYGVHQIPFAGLSAGVYVTIIPGPKIKEVKNFVTYYQPYKLVKTITPQQAMERINQGNAYFFSKEGEFSPQITECVLDYGIGDLESPYLMPMYSFMNETAGELQFYIHVSAVADYYLKKDKEIFAAVDIKPDTIELKSQGKWITAYIELPEGYNVADIVVSSISVTAWRERVAWEASPEAMGDYDHDGISDLMVKFNREAIQAILGVGDRVPIYVTGMVKEKPFRAIDYIRVID